MSRQRKPGTQLERRVERLLAAGDANGAATAVIASLGPGVLGYLCSLLSEDDGHDAFSSFEVDVWRGLPGFRWECALRTWAYRIAWRAAVRLARNGYRRRRLPLPSASAFAPAAPSLPSVTVERRADALERLREELPPEERTLLALRVGRGMSWDEVSVVLGDAGDAASVEALRKRFQRLKRKLAGLARARGLVG